MGSKAKQKATKDSDDSSESEGTRDTKRRAKCLKLAEEEPKGLNEAQLLQARELVRTMPNLNNSQRAAIDAALTRTCTIIQGPPGTGKTHVSVHILSLFAKAMALSPVLATSDSNVAVDNICEGLREKNVRAVRVG